MNLSVNVVIPNWNGEVLLRAHLKAVVDLAKQAEIIVVDDGSTDGSVAYVKTEYPHVRVIQKRNHEGFSSAVNVGVEAARSDVVVLLNTDVEPEKGFLKPLLAHFHDPSVFAVGCLEKSHEEGKIVLRGRGEAAWKKGFFVHWRGEVDTSTTAWVSGGSGAFRKSLWETLGGMDTLMNPFYWEDIDLSYRAVKAGYTIAFEPKSVVHHYHEKGKIQTQFSPVVIKRTAYRNQFLFIWKNVTDVSLVLEHMVFLPVRLFQASVRGDGAMMRGFFSALLYLPAVVQRRIMYIGFWKKSDHEVVRL